MNSASAATTWRLSSSVPMVMRRQLRQPVGGDPAQDDAARLQVGVGGDGVLFSVGKWISTKLPMLGVTSSPSLPISAVTHGSHFSLCATAVSTCACVLQGRHAGRDRRRR